MTLVRRFPLLAALLVAALALTTALLLARRAATPSWAAPRPGAAPAAPSLAPAEWRSRVDDTITALQGRLRERPDEGPTYTRLGLAYLQKARENGDPSLYPRAEAALRRALNVAPGDFEAMGGLGALALARHQFEEALDWGQRAQALNPMSAYAYGVIGDANVELGRYEAAAAAFQAMMDRRPDLSSYARVSYFRELTGDTEGALAAMRRAVAAGGPAAENVAWARTQLGNLLLNHGRPDDAAAEYQAALVALPGYPYALAGEARVQAARGQLPAAAAGYNAALARLPLPQFAVALAEVDLAMGRPDAARAQLDLVRAMDALYRANGVDSDLEMALFQADHGADKPQAVAEARRAFERRPSIKAAHALGWALHRAGRSAEGLPYLRQALRLGTQDALLEFHAGATALAAGEQDEGRRHLRAALDLNPAFSPIYADEARRLLEAPND